MKEYHILVALAIVVSSTSVPSTADQVCEGLRGFLGQRKSYAIPAPMSKVERPYGLLRCAENCTAMVVCRFYKYYSGKNECILFDEQDIQIIPKDNHGGGDLTTRRPNNDRNTLKTKQTCQTGYKYIQSCRTCIRLYPETKTWLQAMKFCLSHNASLVVIKTAKKQKILKYFIRSNIQTRVVWIGARDVNNTDTYTWIDGTPVVYEDWGLGEPSHKFLFGMREENCVQMMIWKGFKWNDGSCLDSYHYICETNPVP